MAMIQPVDSSSSQETAPMAASAAALIEPSSSSAAAGNGDDAAANSTNHRPSNGRVAANATARKRKADEAGVATSGVSSSIMFLNELEERKMVGTLAVWKNRQETARETLAAIGKVASEEAPTPEIAEELLQTLRRGPLGPSSPTYLGLDVSPLQNWVNENHQMMKESPFCWERVYRLYDETCRIPIDEICNKIKEIRDDLKAYAALSNKTETGTRTIDDENEISDSDYREMMRGLHIPSPSKSQENLHNFLGSSEQIQPWWPSKAPQQTDELELFSKAWCRLVEKSAKVDAKALKKRPTLVNNTVKAILEWADQKPERFFSKKHFPTAVATEKDAVQPIVGALLRALSQIRDSDGSLHGRSDLRRERYMPPSQLGPKRFVDFESNHLNPFTPVLLNQEISLVKEVKNVRRAGQNAQVLHDQVSKQVCGHLAKRALVAFDIGDVGVNSKHVGLIVTPVYLQVISLELVGMGTAGAELKFNRTALWPLVDEAAFDALVTDNSDKIYLKPRLFSSESVFSAPGSHVPEGMRRLWELLHSEDEDLGISFFGSEAQSATFIGKRSSNGVSVRHSVGQLLGSGSHGVVYAVAGDNNKIFVKASANGKVRQIERELMALRALARYGTCQYIPEVQGFGLVEYLVRDTTATVPALLMTPRGRPALTILMSSPNKSQTLLSLWSDMSNALSFSHKKDVYHLDLSPRNVMFDGARFILIDWGCAALGNEDAIGFRGSLPFAHAEVHGKANKQSWKPSAKHDIASLLFTVYALREQNPVPWPEFKARLGKGDKAFDYRRQTTIDELSELCKEYKDRPSASLVLLGIDLSTVRHWKMKSTIAACVDGA